MKSRTPIPGWLRIRVFQRDRGVCVVCHLDTMRLQRIAALATRYTWELWGLIGWDGRELLKEMGLPGSFEMAPFDIHHIVAVVFGGRNELTNLETRCRSCHAPETAKTVGQVAKVDRLGVARQAHDEALYGKR